MALIKVLNLLLPSFLTKCNATRIQFYSIFPSNYVKPVYRKEEQDNLYENEEIRKLIHLPILPASAVETSSEFYDANIKKFINFLMRKGDKKLSRSLVERTFEVIKILQLERYNNASSAKKADIILDPKVIFHKAVENCTPILELQKMRKGGITYQVPVPINEQRARFLSMNWLIRTANEKGNNDQFADVLAKELIDAAYNRGRVVKKKQELHKQCEANRVYAHFRWM
ncbi:mitochondrial ribosomal protein S7 [Calliopsis andreniformis]|uniref:mitochondrial ribosomal protein S7 n=1 Tax=Calliopsis andreniformis TaxID=337506 RepID=UPI003FCDE8F3